VRARVEHVFAAQKCRLGLVVRTIGIVRARAKIGRTNLVYNFTTAGLASLARRARVTGKLPKITRDSSPQWPSAPKTTHRPPIRPQFTQHLVIRGVRLRWLGVACPKTQQVKS
jgi:hypothetical protein